MREFSMSMFRSKDDMYAAMRAEIERLTAERDELKAAKWAEKHVDTMNDIAALGISLEGAEAEIERLRAALEIASDEILSMYRTWVADDYEAMPPKNSLPGKAYYGSIAALKGEA